MGQALIAQQTCPEGLAVLLRRFFGLSVGTGFGRGRAALRQDHRRIGIVCACRRCRKLRDGERCRGEQRETKHCHDNLYPRKEFQQNKSLLSERVGKTINCQRFGRIVASAPHQSRYISIRQST